MTRCIPLLNVEDEPCGPEGDPRSAVEQLSCDFEVVAGLAARERHHARELLRGATDAEIVDVRATPACRVVDEPFAAI
jgi:hypothetical protein